MKPTSLPNVMQTGPELWEALKYARRFLKPEDVDMAYIDDVLAKCAEQPSSPAKSNHDLHREIMNLPAKPHNPGFCTHAEYHHYLTGHKEARHAAAALALQLSPAPVNTQGGALREALEFISNRDGEPYAQMTARAALAQAEQEQPAPSIGLSIKDALDQLRAAAPGVTVSINMDCNLDRPAIAHKPDTIRARFRAYVHFGPGDLVAAEANSLPGVLTETLATISTRQAQMPSVEAVNALVAAIQQ